MWLAIAVTCPVGGVWTDVPIWQEYRGRELLLWPDTGQLLASVTIEVNPAEDCDEVFLLLRRFLSAASWSCRIGIKEHMRSGGDSPCPRIGRGPLVPAYFAPSHPRARPLWAVEPSSETALLALALYREGLCASPVVFQYLSFFKILETLVRGRNNLIQLVERHLPQARERIHSPPRADLPDSDLAAYMYENGRCAVAHAHEQPLVDPDDPRGTGDIADILPMIRGVAEIVIEREHRVPRWPPPNALRVWREADEQNGFSPVALRPAAQPNSS